jgi:putative membrane protein
MRLHPVWIVLRAIETLRGFAVPLIIVLVSRRSMTDLIGFGVVGAAVAVSIATRAVTWTRTSYEITGEGIWSRTGLIDRRERFLPVERIQSVNVSESVLHRLFRVVRVTIESAAGGQSGADITLDALTRETAEELRRRIASRQLQGASAGVVDAGAVGATAGVDPGTVTAERSRVATLAAEGELIRALSYRELVLAGVISGRIGPFAAAVGALIQFGDDLLPSSIYERVALSAADLTVQIVIALLFTVAVIAWLVSIVGTLVVYGGFELRRLDDRLLIGYGLLDRRKVSVPIARIQAVTVSEGVLAQPIGRASLRYISAGDGRTSGETGTLLPILPRAEVAAILDRIAPTLSADIGAVPFEGIPGRALRRYMLAPTWTVLFLTPIVCALVWLVLDWPWERGLLTLLLAPLTLLFGLAQFRATGWWIGPTGQIVTRSRPMARVTFVTTRRRVQFAQAASDYLQRRSDLATFSAAVPGGGGRIEIQHLDRGVATRLTGALVLPGRSRPPTATGDGPRPDPPRVSDFGQRPIETSQATPTP